MVTKNKTIWNVGLNMNISMISLRLFCSNIFYFLIRVSNKVVDKRTTNGFICFKVNVRNRVGLKKVWVVSNIEKVRNKTVFLSLYILVIIQTSVRIVNFPNKGRILTKRNGVIQAI